MIYRKTIMVNFIRPPPSQSIGNYTVVTVLKEFDYQNKKRLSFSA
jgi:hypothetical protein